jgi:hypothetical protein
LTKPQALDLPQLSKRVLPKPSLHIFIDFGQLCSSKPTTHVHGNRTVVFMISATRFHPGQHT